MEIVEIIEQLRNESSTNKKVEILAQHRDNEVLKEVMKLTYDPFILFGRAIGIINNNEFEINHECDEPFNSASLYDFEHNIMYNITDEMFNEGISNLAKSHNEKDFKLIKCIINKDLKINMGSSLINKAYGYELIPKFKIQLANPLEEKRIKSYPCKFYVTPKLDGCRAIWLNNRLYSRTGKEFKGLEHIEEECRRIQDKWGVGMLDGELYIPNKPFEYIQSVVSKEDVDKSELEYWVFALPEFEDSELMNKQLHTMWMDNKIVEFLYGMDEGRYEGTRNFNSFNEILEVTDSFVESGWEGCMLRSPTQAYDWKRSDALIKCKKFLDTTLKIVGMEEGTKKNKGKLGAFVCEGEMNDGTFVSTKVGSGFSDIQREEFWNDESLIGRMVDVKYQSISKSKTSDIYSLRFPVFVKWRNDIE